MVGPAARRDAVAHLQTVMDLSERRACRIVSADRKMVRYRSCRPPDTALRSRLRELANARRRFGYRRLFVLLRRDGDARLTSAKSVVEAIRLAEAIHRATAALRAGTAQ